MLSMVEFHRRATLNTFSHKLKPMILVVSMAVITCACGASLPVRTDFCIIYEPVLFSLSDTEETIRQVMRNNVVYERMCKK